MLYGEPLTTLEVINRSRCSRCSGTAWNMRQHVESRLRESLGRDPTAEEVRKAFEDDQRRVSSGDHLRHLLDETTERADRREMRSAWRPGLD
jgi:hypothetical protein